MNKTFPLVGYAPDADPTIWGVITSASSIRPTSKGGVASAFVPSSLAPNMTLAATCAGGLSMENVDGSHDLYLATATNLYKAKGSLVYGTGYTTVTRAAGTYNATDVSGRWSMAQFGTIALATNSGDTVQASTGGNFSCIPGAPAASFIETVGQFVFVARTTDATYGTSPDRWWCSGIGDYTNWTPSAATQATTGRLLSTPGPITGMKKFGDDLIIYKQNSAYRGTYVGPPVIWSFERIPGNFGARCNGAILSIGTNEQPRHLVFGVSGLFIYDGQRVFPVGIGAVWDTIKNTTSYVGPQDTVMGMVDRQNSLAYFYYPGGGGSLPSKSIIYNYAKNTWGRDDRALQMAMEISPLPASSSIPVPLIIDSTMIPMRMDTSLVASTSSSFTLGDMGGDEQDFLLTRVRPRFITKPTTGTMSDGYRMSTGETLVSDTTVTMGTSAQFDTLREARWHRPTFSFTGDWEMDGISMTMEPGGTE